MSRTTTCECEGPHVERVELPPGHLLGPGTVWRAAKPGGTWVRDHVLAGHGWYFDDQIAAEEYAFGPKKKGKR